MAGIQVSSIQVKWEQVDDVVSGLSVGKFEDWRVRSRRAVFTKRVGETLRTWPLLSPGRLEQRLRRERIVNLYLLQLLA